MQSELKIFTGNANPELAKAITTYLGVELGKATISRFADGETLVRIKENVRGRDCFVIQPTCPPVNENLMELLILIDALRRASAERITAVIPYYGYSRQDRKVEPRVPISSKLVANLLTAAGVNRVLSLDLHAGQIQGFFDIPVDNLFAAPVFLEYFRNENIPNKIVVAPDAGGVERARAYAKRLNVDLALIDKRRPEPNQAEVIHVVGDVEGKNCIIVDDLIDTGKTLVKTAYALIEKGARSVIASSAHGVFSGNAIEYIEKSPIERILITNSIPLKRKSPKITVLSVANLLAEAIKRIHTNESVSALFV